MNIMAITKTILDEEVVSKQERNVLRSIYRANALLEGIISLNKISDTLSDIKASSTEMSGTPLNQQEVIDLQVTYLRTAIAKVLSSTKVPTIPIGVKPSTSE